MYASTWTINYCVCSLTGQRAVDGNDKNITNINITIFRHFRGSS